MKRIAIALLALALSACTPGAFLKALTAASQASQWIGTSLDVARSGSDAYFARHPNESAEQRVAAAERRARLALAAYDASLAAAEAADEGDTEAARIEALRAYGELRKLLAELGVLDGRPPLGGAETEAPPPEAFNLPTVEQIATVNSEGSSL